MLVLMLLLLSGGCLFVWLLTGRGSCPVTSLLLREEKSQPFSHLRVVAGHRGSAGVAVTKDFTVTAGTVLVISTVRSFTGVLWLRVVGILFRALPVILALGSGGRNSRGGFGFSCSRLLVAVVTHHLLKLLGVRIVVFVVTRGRSLVQSQVFGCSSFLIFFSFNDLRLRGDR